MLFLKGLQGRVKLPTGGDSIDKSASASLMRCDSSTDSTVWMEEDMSYVAASGSCSIFEIASSGTNLFQSIFSVKAGMLSTTLWYSCMAYA